jgi:hypothetical protein
MATARHAEKRVRRLVSGETTQRSDLDAESVTKVQREQAVVTLRDEDELTLVLDESGVRRAGAEAQEALMKVKALGGGLVNGYQTVNVLGMGQGAARGLLYHHLYSSTAEGFDSQNREVERAIQTTETALKPFVGPKTWVMDRGFDNDAVWWQVWEADSHVVCRVYHFERLVEWQAPDGSWQERYLDATFKHLQPLARVEADLEVRLVGQQRAKKQRVSVILSAVALRVYHPADHSQTKPVWLVKVLVENAISDPWYLLTDWPVTDAASITRIFAFYCRRWAIEDTFKFVKTCFGLEEVHVLTLEAVRTLVAFAWVAAGFLFHLGLTLDTTEVRLLARLGGWEERHNRPPGKQILTRGLRRLLDLMAAEAILEDHLQHYGDLPLFVKQLLATFRTKSVEH